MIWQYDYCSIVAATGLALASSQRSKDEQSKHHSIEVAVILMRQVWSLQWMSLAVLEEETPTVYCLSWYQASSKSQVSLKLVFSAFKVLPQDRYYLTSLYF